ncbi:hypothetical protein GQ457_14G000840 [Hibiscus cannabinus]
MTFQDPWYRYPKGVSNLGTDTQREYRYPREGTDTLRLGTDTLRQNLQRSSATASFSKGVPIPSDKICNGLLQRLVFQKGYRYPKPWYRYPLSRMAELAGKTPPTAPNKVQRSPTARITFVTIKQASKHQGKTNASLYNIIMIKNCLSA